ERSTSGVRSLVEPVTLVVPEIGWSLIAVAARSSITRRSGSPQSRNGEGRHWRLTWPPRPAPRRTSRPVKKSPACFFRARAPRVTFWVLDFVEREKPRFCFEGLRPSDSPRAALAPAGWFFTSLLAASRRASILRRTLKSRFVPV